MLMDRYDLLRQIQRAAGDDPDGPPRPMQPPAVPRRETRAKLRRASEAALRDALLRRALGFLW
jgi:hypothetical protein